MRHVFYFFLYLNICACLFTEINAQVLKLSIVAEQPVSEELKDSLKIQSNFNDYLTLKHQADTIPTLLRKLGYIESELKLLEKKSDSSYIAHYYFGLKYSQIKIYYATENFNKIELSLIATEITDEYFVIPFQNIEASLQKLNRIKAENGNAFAKLRLKHISKEDDDSLTAFLYLDKGSIRKVDSIAIKGYEKFPRSYVKYHAGIKKGKTFSQDKLVT